MKHAHFLSALAAVFTLFTLNACITSSDKITGTVDPATMGTSLSGGESFMSNWAAEVSSPVDSLPSSTPTTSMTVVLAKASALGKVMATAGNTVTVDSTTKDAGYVTVAVTIPGIFGAQITYDTAVVKYDAFYKDNIQNNENIMRFSQTVVWQLNSVPTGASDRIEFSDADGDTLLNVVTGRSNRVKVVFTHTDIVLLKKLVKTGTIVVGPGADNNFSTGADNVVYQANWSRTWASRTDSVYFKNRLGTGEITANDTMHLFIQTSSAISTDTLSSLIVDIAFNPGADLKSSLDDRFYSLHVVSHTRRVFERDGEFTFTPDAPVLHGQQPASGTFSASVTFANGKSATLTGTFSTTGYQATYNGPEGVTKTVVYSKTGAVISSN